MWWCVTSVFLFNKQKRKTSFTVALTWTAAGLWRKTSSEQIWLLKRPKPLKWSHPASELDDLLVTLDAESIFEDSEFTTWHQAVFRNLSTTQHSYFPIKDHLDIYSLCCIRSRSSLKPLQLNLEAIKWSVCEVQAKRWNRFRDFILHVSSRYTGKHHLVLQKFKDLTSGH